jgi:uncharacterized protein (DUF58 family)
MPTQGVIVVAIFAIFVAVLCLRRVGIKKIEYRRYFSQIGVFEGQKVSLVEEIFNPNFFPLFFVDVDAYLYKELLPQGYSPVPYGMQAFTSRFFLAPKTQVRRKIPIECLKRGYYELDSVYVQNRTREAKAKIFVYPRALEYEKINPMENEMQNLEQSSRRLFADPFSFAGVRDYRRGDPFRSINYKATARAQELKVNERDFFSGRSFMIYVDFHSPNNAAIKYNEIMEQSLSYAADMVCKSIKQGYNVGFAANCKKLLGRENHVRYPMRRGEEHFFEILREMAAIRISEGCSLLWLLQQDIDDLWNTDIFIMTAFSYEKNHVFDDIIAALRSKGNAVTVVGNELG